MARIVTDKAISANAVRNNGGTVVYGNSASNPKGFTNVLGRTTVGYNRNGGAFNTAVPAASSTAQQASKLYYKNVKKGLSSGNYAKMLSRKFVITGVTRDIAGIADLSKLVFGTWATPEQPIHKKENTYTRQVRAVTFSYVTGQPTTTPVVTNDGFGNDVAARPTRAVPGRLTITIGSKVRDPQRSNYPAEV
jgi:hypothetical protein